MPPRRWDPNPAAADALADGLIQVLSGTVVAGLLAAFKADSLDLVTFAVEGVDKKAPFPVRPWLTMALPLYDVSPVQYVAQRPDYRAVPPALRSANGSVEVQYVLRQDSTPDLGSLVILERNGTGDLELIARHILSTVRYGPARIGGCAVRQFITQRVRFSNGVRDSSPH